MNNTLEEISEKLKSAKKVAVFCHVRPDGDTLGAGLALCTALNNAGKRAYVLCEDCPPEKFSFLSGMKNFLQKLPDERYDTYITVDCAEASRCGKFSKKFKNFKGVTINVDHHVSNDAYAKYNYVHECPATCLILTDILIDSGFEITQEIANYLMLGIITDSGNFTHLDVDGNTFRTAALLKERGADVNAINYNMYSRQKKARALLYGKVISRIRFLLDDRLAVILITSSDMKKFGADISMTEGFVDFGLSVDGVEVSLSVMEYKKGQYKASLRSKNSVDVNVIAAQFGGGGHVLASGCMLFAQTAEEAISRLAEAVQSAL